MTFISLPAGFAKMPPARFGVYTVAGCIPWTLALAWAGYAVGANWQSIAAGFHAPTYIIAAALVLAVVIAAAARVRHRRTRPMPHTSVDTHPDAVPEERA